MTPECLASLKRILAAIKTQRDFYHKLDRDWATAVYCTMCILHDAIAQEVDHFEKNLPQS